MEQKADKGIEKTEREQRQLAYSLDLYAKLTKQRDKKGKWK